MKLLPAPDRPLEILVVVHSPDRTRTEIATEYPQNDVWGFFTFPILVPQPLIVPEVFVKALDARPIGGGIWVFWNGLTTLTYELTIEDPASGTVRTYTVEGKTGFAEFPAVTPAPPAPELVDLLVMPIGFLNAPCPVTEPEATQATLDVIRFWVDQGSPVLTWHVEPPLILARALPDRCQGPWWGEAVAAARPWEGRQNAWLSPQVPGCGRSNASIYIDCSAGRVPGILAHEVGHAIYGMDHTHAFIHARGSAFDPDELLEKGENIGWKEYGGGDVMGAGSNISLSETPPLSIFHAVKKKWIPTPPLVQDEPLHVPVRAVRDTRWTYWVDFWDAKDRFRLWISGPYIGSQNSYNSVGSYYLGMFEAGEAWTDDPSIELRFLEGRKVERMS